MLQLAKERAGVFFLLFRVLPGAEFLARLLR